MIEPVVFSQVLLRALLDTGSALRPTGQRLGAAVALNLFALGVLALQGLLSLALWRRGRHLELRLRIEFLRKLPHLNDRYFQSRLPSDMAERGHGLHRIR